MDGQRATVQFHEFAADREPKPGPAIAAAGRGIRLNERLAQLRQGTGFDPDAGVFDDQADLAAGGSLAADRDTTPPAGVNFTALDKDST